MTRAAYSAGADLLRLNVNGVTPFLSHRDALNDRLGEAAALLTVVEMALNDMDGAPPPDAENYPFDGLNTLRPGIKAFAVEGIKTLVFMAIYHADNLGEA